MRNIAFWKTKSFWSLVIAVAAPVLAPDVGEAEQAALVDGITMAISGGAAVYSWAQRWSPQRTIALNG